MAVDKKRKSAVMIDVGIPSDSNDRKKVHEKPAPTQLSLTVKVKSGSVN